MNAGRELDALIAEKVMGWRRLPECGNLHEGNRCKSDQIPPYSTDIAAAWQVVEAMQAKDAAVLLRFDMRYTGKWEAGFGIASDEFPSAVAETPARAICLAALKAVGYEEVSL